MPKYFDNKFVDALKSRILKGDFKSKEELIHYLKELPILLKKDHKTRMRLMFSNLKVDAKDIVALTPQILEYYDKKMVNTSGLDLQNVSTFKNDTSEYLKMNGEQGPVVLETGQNRAEFTKEFQDRQNQTVNYKSTDGIKNASEIMQDMRKDKKEVNLVSSLDVNNQMLTLEQRAKIATIKRMDEYKTDDFIVSPEDNMFINKRTGEPLYVTRNEHGAYEVKKAKEVKSKTEEKQVQTVDEQGYETDTEVTFPGDIDLTELTEFELMTLSEQGANVLTPAQKEKIAARLQEIKDKNLEASKVKENEASMQQEKRMNLILPTKISNTMSDKAAFINLFLVSTVAGFTWGAVLSLILTILKK